MEVSPGSITVEPWMQFQFVCTGSPGEVEAVFQQTGALVSGDPRFRVERVNKTSIQVVAPRGLRGMDNMAIM